VGAKVLQQRQNHRCDDPLHGKPLEYNGGGDEDRTNGFSLAAPWKRHALYLVSMLLSFAAGVVDGSDLWDN